MQALERIFRRRVPPDQVTSVELASALATVSSDFNRQVGVLIDRRGLIEAVVVGDANKLVLPDVGRHRAGEGRLRGVRLVHTHLRGEALTQDDLTDLALLRLDLVAAITIDGFARPDRIHCAYLLPDNPDKTPWRVLDPVSIHALDVSLPELLRELEADFARSATARSAGRFETSAIVVHVDRGSEESDAQLDELMELCRSAGVRVVEVLRQQRSKPDPKFVVGKGKLDDIVLRSMQLDVDLLVFSEDLSPGQARAVTDACELRVIDRTQLILDIFAQRASSRDGKLQVELAQLRYNLPRLVTRNTGLSRLTGGIGGRGPGETKLEIDRRRAKDRIRHLEEALEELRQKRAVQRKQRQKGNLPVVSLVGYTNAGKSTLLNALTGSHVVAEDKLFATLDPTTRRLRFPEEREIVLTDTVGFIRDLPESLTAAFRATLEELEFADLLLHVADASNQRVEAQIQSVNAILRTLHLDATPILLVLNKIDQANGEAVQRLQRSVGGFPVCALQPDTVGPLMARMEHLLWRAKAQGRPTPASPPPE